jgi:hypothetical protein
MAADKRRSTRKAHSAAIEIFGPDRQLLGFGRLLEYSETGASFIAEERLLPDDTVRARMRIFEKGIIEVTAKIIWRKPENGLAVVGVRFEKVTRSYPSGSVG